MVLVAHATDDFYSGEISQEARSQAHEKAQTLAEQTDNLRPISFWLLIGSVLCLLWSGCVAEPVSKVRRNVSVIVIAFATLMQFVLV